MFDRRSGSAMRGASARFSFAARFMPSRSPAYALSPSVTTPPSQIVVAQPLRGRNRRARFGRSSRLASATRSSRAPATLLHRGHRLVDPLAEGLVDGRVPHGSALHRLIRKFGVHATRRRSQLEPCSSAAANAWPSYLSALARPISNQIWPGGQPPAPARLRAAAVPGRRRSRSGRPPANPPARSTRAPSPAARRRGARVERAGGFAGGRP